VYDRPQGFQAVSERRAAADLLVTPGALLSRSHLRELGLERRAVDAVFRALDVIQFPGAEASMGFSRASLPSSAVTVTTCKSRRGVRQRPSSGSGNTVASAWVARRPVKDGVRYRVMFRLGGRESAPRYAGAFKTMREAKSRRDFVAGELAAMRVPDLRLTAGSAPTLVTVAEQWRASRVDVSEGTRVLHRVALGRVLPILGDRTIDTLTGDDIASPDRATRCGGEEARDDPQVG
jgi:hypothetical protein